MIGWEDIVQYLSVFMMLIGSGFGLPIPEELPIVIAGVMVGREWNNPDSGMFWWIMLPVCIIGVVLCDALLYWVGRKWGPRLLSSSWVQRRLLKEDKRKQIEENFHKYGIGILLAARLTPGIRTPIFLMSGMLRLPFRRFLLADGIYAIPGVNLLFWLAYWFTDQFQRAFYRVSENKHLVVAVILAAVGGFLTYSFLFRRRVATGSPQDIPVIGDKVGTALSHISTPVPSEKIEEVEKKIHEVEKKPAEQEKEAPLSDGQISANGPPQRDPAARDEPKSSH
jgi:membrane protein DedA with SNARE-associated domain